MKNLLIATALLLPSTALAQSQFQSMQLAQELGTLLGSEQHCGLAYNQNAIEKWIDQKTDPSDMGFASTLNLMVEGTQLQLQSQNQSSRTAHCRSIRRTAKHYGFIE